MLGKQAEFLFEKYLSFSKKYHLIAANTQVQGEKQTLGELDYIVRDTYTNKNIHIELACKFYLFDDTIKTSYLAKWIGPNRKDSLHDKITKLTQKQFPILHNPATTRILSKHNLIATDIEQQLCLKTFLFIPKKLETSIFTEAFKKCIVGYWVLFSELVLDEDALYYIPSKKGWLQPITTIKIWIDYKQTRLQISEKIKAKRAPLVYKKTGQNVERFFVVWW